ncbi:hypothetical protein LTR16_009313, partial [Cryomyces antarcticus]
QPAARLRQAAGRAAGDPAEARQDDLARRGQPGLARAAHLPDVPPRLRAAGRPALGPHRPAQVLRHPLRPRHRRRGRQHLRRPRPDAGRHGQRRGDVPSHLQVRCHPGRHRGDPGRSGRQAGHEGLPEEHAV